MKMLLFK